MLTKQHRRVVFTVIHQRVVQAATARTEIERDIGELGLLDQVDDGVRLPTLGGFFDFRITSFNVPLASWAGMEVQSRLDIPGLLLRLFISENFDRVT